MEHEELTRAIVKELRAIPGVEVQIVAPEAYGKGNSAPHAMEIFQYSAPAALPDTSALFILPPTKNPLVDVAEIAAAETKQQLVNVVRTRRSRETGHCGIRARLIPQIHRRDESLVRLFGRRHGRFVPIQPRPRG